MFLTLLEDIINRILRLDPDTLSRLGEMDDKVIGVRVVTTREPIEFFVLPGEAGLRLRHHVDEKPDVTIAGDVPFFARILYTRATTGAAPTGDLQISGDIELGQRFKAILDRIDIDWEEGASHYVGDVIAHTLGNAARELRGWVRLAGATLGQDISEYFQEESRTLAKRENVKNFLSQVDTLRGDVDRLDMRLQRLAGKAK
jgi:ubiquinone biosynthesis protein UbiJ